MAMQSPDCAEKDPPLNSEHKEVNESLLNELVEFFRDTIGDNLAEGEYRYTAPDKAERNYWVYIVEVVLGIDKNVVSVQPCHVDEYEPEPPEEDENESGRANRQAEELLREEEALNASQQKISSSKTLKKKRKKQKAKQGKEIKPDEVDEQQEGKGERNEGEKDEGYAGEKDGGCQGDNVNEEERAVGYEGERDEGYEVERGNNTNEEKDDRYEGEKVDVDEEERAIGYEGERVNVDEKSAVGYEGERYGERTVELNGESTVGYEGGRAVGFKEKRDEGYEGEKAVGLGYEEGEAVGYEGERVYEGEEERADEYEGEKVNVEEKERADGYKGKRAVADSRIQNVVSAARRPEARENIGIDNFQEEAGDDAHKHFYKKVGRKQYNEKESCSADGRQKDPKEENESSLPEFTADEGDIYLSHKAEENYQVAFVGDGRDIYLNENTMPGENVDGVQETDEVRQYEEKTVSGENVNVGQHKETIEKSEEPKQAMEGIFSKENVSVAQDKDIVRQIREPEQAPGNTISREKVPEAPEIESVKQTQEPKQARNVDKVQGKKRVKRSKRLKQQAEELKQARNVNVNEVQDKKRVKKSKRLKQQTEELKQATEGIFSNGNASETQDTQTVRVIEEPEQGPENIIPREKVPEALEIDSVKQTQEPKQARNVDEVQDKKRVKKSKRLNQQTKDLEHATESIFSKGNVSEAQDTETVRQIEEPEQDPENIISREKVPEALETESVKQTQEPKQGKNLVAVQDKNKSKRQKEPRASANSGPVGIRNLGSTCYMNAAFQFLLRPMGRKWLDLDKQEAATTDTDTDLTKEFHQLWDLLLSNNGGSTIEPESTKRIQSAWNRFKHPSSPTFEPTQQEDAEEFMTFIFTHLLNGLLCTNAFQVKYIKASCCRICPNAEVIHTHQYPSLRLGLRDNGVGAFDLEELLVNKFQNSVCTEYFCGRCYRNYMGNYNRFIFTSEFLIIWLPRTTRLTEVGIWKRQYKLRNIPHDLDLKPYFANEKKESEEFTRYKLHAVLTHFGQSMDSGHYLAAVFDTISGTWFKFDDDRVTKLVDFQREVGNDAYMLLYRNLAQGKLIEGNENGLRRKRTDQGKDERGSAEMVVNGRDESSKEEKGEAQNGGKKD